jgi:hypothetical protein
MSDRDIHIDEAAAWTSLGGHIRLGREPTAWRRKSSGGWECKELVPFGEATAEYRTQYYRCAGCARALLPTNIEYRFGCVICGLVFGWSFGGLWGYPAGHEKAMYLTAHLSKQRHL